MPEFQSQSALRHQVGRFFRRPGLLGMSLMVALVFALSGPNAERLGDRFQVALPVFALGCAIADGGAVRLLGRYLLLEVFIKVPKNTLGEASINIRPNGGIQGFPSGHTAASTFGATALVQSCLAGNPAAQAVAIFSAGFTGASRITSDNHTIWQVLAGAILGFLMNFLTLTAFDALFARTLRRIGAFFGLGSAAALALALLPAPQADAADWTLDVYTGFQNGPHARVTGEDLDPDGAGVFNFLAGWEGRSFAMPPYYGFRATRWRDEGFGLFADFNHTKLYADDETLEASGFAWLEFSDGLNNLTFGPLWRWPGAWDDLSPYVGVGLGAAIPHVEVQTTPDAARTFEYQLAGPSFSFMTGVERAFGAGRTSGFVEYKFTYSQLDADLIGGGTLSTDVITNALNVGVRVALGKR